MDYAGQSRMFQLQKAARYTRLYGPRRTIAKIDGQLHMRRRALPPNHARKTPGATVGILGCGNFAYANVAHYLHRNVGPVVRATMDSELHRAASLYKRYKADYYTDDADRILNDDAISLVYVASNHASHADYAATALQRGKAVHIEKPHAVTWAQLECLVKALQDTGGRVQLGFNRPESRFGLLMRQAIDREAGPGMYNWFVAGHAIEPDHWYFRPEEGGRILGNLCHWTDFVYQLVPEGQRYPIIIRPTRAERSDCDIAVTYTFGDGTIAAITFSAKGHTFEGVRERFSGHRGNLLISMDDFSTLEMHTGMHVVREKNRFRDHGHEARILKSYEMAAGRAEGVSVAYVWESGELFLATKDALESSQEVTVHGFPGRGVGST